MTERMEAKLIHESGQNSALNIQVTQLKQEIAIAMARSQKDVSVAQLESKLAVEAAEARAREERREMEEEMTALFRGAAAEGEAREWAPAPLNPALEAEIERLKAQNKQALTKQREMDATNARLAEEARTAREAAKREIEAQTEALEALKGNWEEESKQNTNLKELILQLKDVIGAAKAKQEARDEVATQAKEEAEAKILAQTEALQKVQDELRSESQHNSAIEARNAQMNQSINEARARQEALDEEARRIKEEATARIVGQTKTLKRMELNWHAETKRNDVLVTQTAQLQKRIAAAEEERREQDRARARAEGEARERAEAKILAQAGALRATEDELREASAARAALHERVARLTAAHASRRQEVPAQQEAAGAAREDASARTETTREDATEDLGVTPESREWSLVEGEEVSLTDLGAGSSTLQENVGSLSRKILAAQDDNAEKLRLVRMGKDSEGGTFDAAELGGGTGCHGCSSGQTKRGTGWFQTLLTSNHSNAADERPAPASSLRTGRKNGKRQGKSKKWRPRGVVRGGGSGRWKGSTESLSEDRSQEEEDGTAEDDKGAPRATAGAPWSYSASSYDSAAVTTDSARDTARSADRAAKSQSKEASGASGVRWKASKNGSNDMDGDAGTRDEGTQDGTQDDGTRSNRWFDSVTELSESASLYRSGSTGGTLNTFESAKTKDSDGNTFETFESLKTKDTDGNSLQAVESGDGGTSAGSEAENDVTALTEASSRRGADGDGPAWFGAAQVVDLVPNLLAKSAPSGDSDPTEGSSKSDMVDVTMDSKAGKGDQVRGRGVSRWFGAARGGRDDKSVVTEDSMLPNIVVQ